MSYFRNLWRLFRNDKGISILMLFVCVFAIGMVVTVIYHLVERPQRMANVPRGLDELVKQLDQTLDSVKEKTNVEALNFAVTPEAEADDDDTLVLNGVLWSGVDSLAIINKKIVGIADRVGDCWVIDIEENSVNLRCRDGEERVLRCY